MDNSPSRKRGGRSRRLWIWLVVAVGILVLAGAGALGFLLALQPVTLEGPAQSEIVQIESGLGVWGIGRLLEQKGLVRHAWAFVAQAYLSRAARGLQAGYYQLSSDMSTGEIVAALASGESAMRKVTFPEGYGLDEISALLEKEQVCDRPSFLGAASDEAVNQALGVVLPAKAGTAEGYLFPDTYFFGVGEDPARVVAAMLAQFKAKFYDPIWLPAAARRPWGNLHQVVTLASLVEKEAQVDSERARIAGVLLKRLRQNMLLQCDATVQYALGQHKPRLTLEDLKVDSPYNTYKYPGLPPGPICCPGLPSLQAALYPEATDYLFYVAKPDGTHIFSRTYQEHLAAIRALRGGR
jgi:UPF0755 protein